MLITTYVGLDAAINAEMRTGCHLIVKSLANRSRKHGAAKSLRGSNGKCCVISPVIRLNYPLRVHIPMSVAEGSVR